VASLGELAFLDLVERIPARVRVFPVLASVHVNVLKP